MIQNPILKVLSTLKEHDVKCLLIGGQACIVYGAAEFSRDSDFVILCERKNIEKLQNALSALKAKTIYAPPLKIEYLERGHACHFRCNAQGLQGLRIDILSKMRRCAPFEELWKRKKMVKLKGAITINVLGLEDLVQSKKTQRDKDWLMLKRLVENDIILNKANPSEGKIKWWLLESRNVESLVKLTQNHPALAKKSASQRPLLSLAIQRDTENLSEQLAQEELLERRKDVEYWKPLRGELEVLRHRFSSR